MSGVAAVAMQAKVHLHLAHEVHDLALEPLLLLDVSAKHIHLLAVGGLPLLHPSPQEVEEARRHECRGETEEAVLRKDDGADAGSDGSDRRDDCGGERLKPEVVMQATPACPPLCCTT